MAESKALTKFTRKGIWYLRGTVRGESVYESTGTRDEEAAEALRIKREGAILDRSVFGRRATATFLEAAVSYLDAGGEARFVGKYDEKTGTWSGLIGHFGTMRLALIGQQELDAAAAALLPSAAVKTRKRQIYTPFIAIWRHGATRDLCEARIWERPEEPKRLSKTAPRAKRRGTKPVAYDRAARFVTAMSPAAAITMTLMFYTGMRPIELFVLDCDDVLVDERWIVLDGSKSDEPRGVPIHEFLVPLLTEMKKRGGHLVRTYRGKPYAPKDDGGGQMKTAIRGAARRSGIKDVSPYTGRHSVSTQLVVEGVHPYLKDQILGHAATDMSRHYTHVPQPPLIEAINKLPVPEIWRAAEWMTRPLDLMRKNAMPADWKANHLAATRKRGKPVGSGRIRAESVQTKAKAS